MTTLRGLTWAHSRGYVPLVAAAEAWHDLHAEAAIVWDKRSLWGFGEGPLEEAARTYDLIVFDHPFTGRAAARGLFLPLDDHLPVSYLAGLERDSAGPSFRSYSNGGRQWGLPLDAASQIAVCRADLLAATDHEPPRTWEAVIALARKTGKVRAALSPMGAMGMFHTLCAAQGSPAYPEGGGVVERRMGLRVLDQLRMLFDAVGEEALSSSPVRILGVMATSDTALYSPLVYGYSNYCRAGFAPRKLQFLPMPCGDGVSGAVLGGAGLAVSAFSAHRELAVRFAAWVCGADCQGSLYLFHGGQPASRTAWTSEAAHAMADGYFRAALPLIEGAFVRPTYDGYTDSQSAAGALLHQYLKGDQGAAATLDGMDRILARSRAGVLL